MVMMVVIVVVVMMMVVIVMVAVVMLMLAVWHRPPKYCTLTLPAFCSFMRASKQPLVEGTCIHNISV